MTNLQEYNKAIHRRNTFIRLRRATFQAIGDQYNITRQRVRQIVVTEPQLPGPESVFSKLGFYPKGREFTRMLVRMRDNFSCRDCGKRRTPKQAKRWGKRLYDIHHLNGLCGKRSRSYDRREDMDGLITLCHKCHFNRPEHASNNKKLEHFH